MWLRKLCFSKKANPIKQETIETNNTLQKFNKDFSTPPSSSSSSILPKILTDNKSPVIQSSDSPNSANISTVLIVAAGEEEEAESSKPEPRRLTSLSLTTTNSIPPPPHLISLIPPTPLEAPFVKAEKFDRVFPSIPQSSNSIESEKDLNSSSQSQSCLFPTSADTSEFSRSESIPPLLPPNYQHRRTSSGSTSIHKFKETINAFENDDGEGGTRTINQYVLKGVIGRGSYATVEKATDREGIDYAVKEFSKAKLRKRAASEMMRGNVKMRGRRAILKEEPVPIDLSELGPDNLSLIRSEVAIMKKVSHPNICVIHEVIDVTASDTLLVVMELCEGGPITHVSLDKESEPLSESKCRSIFRQLLLGLAYLHHNSIIHRDIKPDNCLFMADKETVKIVDFGVSEMFIKSADDIVEKSVGSPAFMAPELCAAKHGHLHGFACDIWSLGATLFTLACGRVPFAKDNLLDLINSISDDPLIIPSNLSIELQHLFSRILDKNPHTRITMLELWENPWVTEDGSRPMMDYELNCANPILEPTTAEVDSALRSLRSSFLVAKIAGKFRRGMHRRSLSSSSDTTTSPIPSSSSTFSPNSPLLLSSSPVSSPFLSSTSFSTSQDLSATDTTIGFLLEASSFSDMKDRSIPLRNDTASSISTFGSGIGNVRNDRMELRSDSPSSSIGAVIVEGNVLMMEPEDMK